MKPLIVYPSRTRVRPHALEKAGFRPRGLVGAVYTFTHAATEFRRIRCVEGEPRPGVFPGRKWRVLIFLARHWRDGGAGNCWRWLLNLLAFASRRGKKKHEDQLTELFGGIGPLRCAREILFEIIKTIWEEKKKERNNSVNECEKFGVSSHFFVRLSCYDKTCSKG